jgi:hypothetical protein
MKFQYGASGIQFSDGLPCLIVDGIISKAADRQEMRNLRPATLL